MTQKKIHWTRLALIHQINADMTTTHTITFMNSQLLFGRVWRYLLSFSQLNLSLNEIVIWKLHVYQPEKPCSVNVFLRHSAWILLCAVWDDEEYIRPEFIFTACFSICQINGLANCNCKSISSVQIMNSPNMSGIK